MAISQAGHEGHKKAILSIDFHHSPLIALGACEILDCARRVPRPPSGESSNRQDLSQGTGIVNPAISDRLCGPAQDRERAPGCALDIDA